MLERRASARVSTLNCTARSSALALVCALGFTPPLAAQILLQAAQNVATQGTARDVEAADLDGDGDLDLAVSCDAPPAVELFDNIAGIGIFSSSATVPLPAGSAPRGLAVCDLNHDGKLDLAVALSGIDGIGIVISTPSGYVLASTVPAVGAPTEIEAADLDLDGDWDLVATCPGNGSVAVLLNQSGAGFTGYQVPVGMGIGELGVAELTGDGQPDVALCVASSSSIEVLAGSGGGFLVPAQSLPVGAVQTQALALGDVDGDGDVDMTYTYELNGFESFRVFFQTAPGQFTSSGNITVSGQGVTSAVVSDLDADGDPDLAVVSTGTGTLVTFENLAPTQFDVFGSQWPGTGSPERLTAADVDGNGGVDLLAASGSGVSVLKNVFSGPTCSVLSYCTPKTNSLGLDARIQGVGTPAFGPQGFSILMTSGVPGAVGIAFESQVGPASTPFLGGTFCVQPPTIRFAPRPIDAAGQLGYAVPVDLERVGATTWYQFWYRDPTHPDGTGAALSDALAVTFCD